MRITKQGSDFITVNDKNLNDKNLISIPRVHLIKLDFFKPSEDKINKVLGLYPRTNRYVIENNIRIYNYTLRLTSKKYYIENSKGTDIITFFRKNNKILLNFLNLSFKEKEFLLTEHVFEDILKNTEVIYIDQYILVSKHDLLKEWNGNVIIDE